MSDEYRKGFEAGYRAVKGTYVPMVPIWPEVPTWPNMTPFLMGLRRGLKCAGVDLDDYR